MRLLVVEDEKHLNQTLTERLTKIGYTVDNCFDGEDALLFQRKKLKKISGTMNMKAQAML